MSDPNQPLPSRPAWEVDFPLERVEAQHVTRREFSKFLVLVSGGLAGGSAVVAVRENLVPEPTLAEGVRVCATGEVPVDGMKAFTLPGTNLPGFVVRLGENTWRAYEQKCPHLSCAVFYKPASGRIECPCHNGAFDVRTGSVIQGPAPRPLRQFQVEVRGDGVFLVPEAPGA